MLTMRLLLGAAVLLVLQLPHTASAFQLFTEDEARAVAQSAQKTPDALKRRIDVDAPLITLKMPDAAKPVRSPVDIELGFEARAGAQIVPETFKVRYLFMDLTPRIRPHASIDRDGLRAKGAELPRGSFRLSFEVADTQQRVGRLDVNVTIE